MKKLLLNLMMVVGITTVSVAQDGLVSTDSNKTSNKPMLLHQGMNFDSYLTKGQVGYYKYRMTHSSNYKMKIFPIGKSESTFTLYYPQHDDCGNCYDLVSLFPPSPWYDSFGTEAVLDKDYYFKIENNFQDTLAIFFMEYSTPNDNFTAPMSINLNEPISINYDDYTIYRDYDFESPMNRNCKTSVHDTNTIDMYYSFIATDSSMALNLNMTNSLDETLIQYNNNICLDEDKTGELERQYIFDKLMIGEEYKFRLEIGKSLSNTNQKKSNSANVSFTLKNNKITAIESVNESNNFNISPNPSNGNFVVDVKESTNFKVFNTMGENVSTLALNEGSNNVSLNLEAGVYLIQSQNSDGISTQKLVIE